ncbi:MAG: class I SAM-dependent rRNA methyltransferase [Thermoanaerobaculia bacterium]
MVICELRKGKEKLLENKHPWVFESSIYKIKGEGSFCEIENWEGKKLAWGIYSSKSQIKCRILEFRPYEKGREKIIGEKVREAITIRRMLLQGETDGFRLINAEGDLLPGVTVDIYGDIVVVSTTVEGWENTKEEFLYPHIKKQWPSPHFFEKNNVDGRFQEKLTMVDRWILGKVEMPVMIKENGLKFLVDIEKGQKTGFFLDQRENRRLIKEISNGAEVLNAFSYTGSFSVYALKGGARSVQNVDTSLPALNLSEENHKINGFSKDVAININEDCFEYLRHLVKRGAKFDIVILDPPALCKNRSQIENALKAYKDLNLQAMKLLRPQGFLLTCSCSSHISPQLFSQTIFEAAKDAKVNLRILYKKGASFDHPVNIYCPESEYLKAYLCTITP